MLCYAIQQSAILKMRLVDALQIASADDVL